MLEKAGEIIHLNQQFRWLHNGWFMTDQTISPAHSAYRARVVYALSKLGDPDAVHARLAPYAEALLVLWHLDLEPCRTLLMACRAANAHGSKPWDPVLILRCLLLSMLVGTPALNPWSRRLRADPILQLLAGFGDKDEDGGVAKTPSIGSFYDSLHRLHDGPRPHRGAERESALERRRSREARKRNQPEHRRRSKAARKKEQQDVVAQAKDATAKLVKVLQHSRKNRRPEDLAKRMSELLWRSGVLESVRRGLMEIPRGLPLVGDGTPLPTAASGHGRRVCSCARAKKCDCERVWPDPTATRGYDSYRDTYFYGYNLYEIGTVSDGAHLPLMLRLNPSNRVDHLTGAEALEDLGKLLRDDFPGLITPRFFVADCGHDALANHEHIRSWGLRPIIPLRGDAPAEHPDRDGLLLSPRAVPLCQAKVEMAAWGTCDDKTALFICPVKARKMETCPLAPAEQPDWLCEPTSARGPVVALNVNDNPRLFPIVPRNSPAYGRLYKQRSSCERSNSIKKQALDLLSCRHRRWSFWFVRATCAALLQHARVWVRDIDAQAWLRDLIANACVRAA